MNAFLTAILGGATGAGLVVLAGVGLAAILLPRLSLRDLSDPYEGDADEVDVRRRG